MLLQEITYLAAAEVWDEFRWQHAEIPTSVSAADIMRQLVLGPEFSELRDQRDDANANPHEELMGRVNHRLNEAMLTHRRCILPNNYQLRISGLGNGDTLNPPGVAGSAIFHLSSRFSQRCHLRFRVTDSNVSVVLRTFARSPNLGRDLFILALGKPNTGPAGDQPVRIVNALTYSTEDMETYRLLTNAVLKIALKYVVPEGDKIFLSYMVAMLDHHAQLKAPDAG